MADGPAACKMSLSTQPVGQHRPDQIGVVPDDPGDEILGPLAAILRCHPQLKILKPVIVADAILMVYVLERI